MSNDDFVEYLSHLATRTKRLNRQIALILNHVIERTGADSGSVQFLQHSLGASGPEEALEVAEAQCFEEDRSGYQYFVREDELFRAVLEDGSTKYWPNLANRRRRQESFDTGDAQCMIMAPILDRDAKIRGVLTLDGYTTEKFTPEHETYATLAGQVIGSLKIDDSQDPYQNLVSVRDLSTALLQTIDKDEIAQQVADAAVKFLGGEALGSSAVYRFDPVHEEIIGGASAGKRGNKLLSDLPRSTPEGTTMQVIRSRRPLYISNPSGNNPMIVERSRKVVKAVYTVPIFSAERMIGALYTERLTKSFYSSDEQAVLLSFANSAASALDNADLHTTNRRTIEIQRRLTTATTALSSMIPPDELYHRVAAQALDLLKPIPPETAYPVGAILTLLPQETFIPPSKPIGAGDIGSRLTRDENLGLILNLIDSGDKPADTLVVLSKLRERLSGSLGYQHLAELLDKHDIEAAIYLPLLDSMMETVAQLIVFFNKPEIDLGPFSNALQTFSDHAGLSLQNAYLIQQQDEANRIIQTIEYLGRTQYDIEARATTVLKGAMEYTGATRGSICLVPYGALDNMYAVTVLGDTKENLERALRICRDEQRGIMREAIQSRRPVLVPNIATDPIFSRKFVGLPESACELAVPILPSSGDDHFQDGAAYGVINLESENSGSLTLQHQAFVVELARHTYSMLQDAELFHIQKKLQRTVHGVAADEPLETLLQSVVDSLDDATHYDMVILYSYDPDEQAYTGVYVSKGKTQAHEVYERGTHTGSVAWKLMQYSEHAPIFESASRNNPQLNQGRFLFEENVYSSAYIPLVVGENRIVGQLFINLRRYHEFTVFEQAMLQAFGDNAAVAINRVLEVKRREQEEKERQDDVYVTISGLIAALSRHHIGNQSAAITRHVDFLEKHIQLVKAWDEVVEENIKGIDRANAQIEQYRISITQLTDEGMTPAPLDLMEFLNNLIPSWRRKVGDQLSIQMDLEQLPNPVLTISNPTILEVVFLATFENAQRELEKINDPDDRCIIVEGHADDRFVYVDISNTGRPIDPDLFDHLCVELISRPDEKGKTGVGLWFANKLLAKLGGSIRPFRKPGFEGATFRYTFKLLPEDA